MLKEHFTCIYNEWVHLLMFVMCICQEATTQSAQNICITCIQ